MYHVFSFACGSLLLLTAMEPLGRMAYSLTLGDDPFSVAAQVLCDPSPVPLLIAVSLSVYFFVRYLVRGVFHSRDWWLGSSGFLMAGLAAVLVTHGVLWIMDGRYLALPLAGSVWQNPYVIVSVILGLAIILGLATGALGARYARLRPLCLLAPGLAIAQLLATSAVMGPSPFGKGLWEVGGFWPSAMPMLLLPVAGILAMAVVFFLERRRTGQWLRTCDLLCGLLWAYVGMMSSIILHTMDCLCSRQTPFALSVPFAVAIVVLAVTAMSIEVGLAIRRRRKAIGTEPPASPSVRDPG